MPNLLKEFKSNPASSLVTIRCYPWAKKNTCVIGDAAHALVPFYGQGMNAGFEDCHLLDKFLGDAKGDDWSGAIKAFYESRKPDADAIADLALYNFIEMRDSVADDQFLLRKKIESRLSTLLLHRWTPLYTLVTFSNVPYSEAQKQGHRQKNIMDKLLTLPQIGQKYTDDNWLLKHIEPLLSTI